MIMIRQTLLYSVYQRPQGTWWTTSRLSQLKFDSARKPASLERIQFFCNTRSLGKKDKSRGGPTDFDSHVAKSDSAAIVDPLDLSFLHDGVADALKRLKDDLSKLRAGGRLNPDVIENLRVHLKGDKESVRLGDLAQVIPKGGRTLTIMVGEEGVSIVITHEASVGASPNLLASNLSLTPQRDPHHLQLNVQIPPPTKDSRDQTIKTAKTAMERAANSVRKSRSTLHKRLQEMQKKKIARPDDVRKAHDQMEKVVEKGQKEVRDLFETARKSIEQS
ncbi:hypothetical protein Egran_02340 [Elaphomyces granulatus]|uniref:Ribosome recycling factor domain-containing protein n=1 Tax=Elaphomyces granulatus TaxID=519963 RepID=A0A232M0L6_9EURO|nr:hypothetical protein Egran_02340 [Elaphomyces granulatus]